jgi:hypothetical protein
MLQVLLVRQVQVLRVPTRLQNRGEPNVQNLNPQNLKHP